MFDATKYIMDRMQTRPRAAIILGSGLGDLVHCVENPLDIPYHEIPGFMKSTAPGHAGKLVLGTIEGMPCMLMSGRFHYYEGYEPTQIVLPIRVMKELGVEVLVATNAAGGVNTNFHAGDLMLIEDHLNFSGMNPLRGPNDEKIGARFTDMTYAYHRKYGAMMVNAASEAGIPMRHGVYAMMSGPSFETPAEIRMLRTLGADAVGMSTVPEVIAANHCGLPVVAVSCITNMAAGVLDQPITHVEVLEMGERVKGKFTALMIHFIRQIEGIDR